MIRAAWILPGGIAGPTPADVNPVLTSLFARMSVETDLTAFVFSSKKGHESFRIHNGVVHFLPADVRSGARERYQALRAAFTREHATNRFEVVHGFWALPSGGFAALLGRIHGIPSVASFLGGEGADLPDVPYGNMVRLSSRMLTKVTFRAATAVHVLTQYQASQLRLHGMSSPNVRTIPFGADAVFIRRKDRTLSPPYRLLHVANLTEVKDQSTLLRSFERIVRQVPATLRVVGKDQMSGRLQREAEALGLTGSVEFVGEVPHARMPDHFAWAHLYLHSSLYEGQSVSVVEAMSSGVPVCGTRVGIVADLPETLAVTVDPGDHIALAHAAVQLLTDEGRYAALRTEAREWAIDHSMEYTVTEFLRMYRDLTPSSAGV